MEQLHLPVMLAETMEYLAPKPGGIYVDCTVGAGGHSREILRRLDGRGRLFGIDRDPAALELAARNLAAGGEQVILVPGRFSQLGEILRSLSLAWADGFLFDLGLSSMQVDEAQRGFSYQQEAPLDMRMDPREPVSARDLVNAMDRESLMRILRDYGEERWASRIAGFIVHARSQRPIATTAELVEVIKEAIPASARRRGGHPARRTFQALRIAVNNELEELSTGLQQAIAHLAPGGRICVISFHSLEDRIVKRTFGQLRQDAGWEILTPRPVGPQGSEKERNPRSRSAKLRAVARVLTVKEAE
ncbi:MAG: 16S rRNA (cytosine(1402)-N(4))-methyltransferase RsmH [Clostridia bacterium]|nr:MAG: 16S rRNA (cytosine(1402)-N(4))-methyltransferase RsmH [Clostridia bacterium]